MKSHLTVLLIQDSPNHINDVNAMLGSVGPTLPVKLNVVHVTTLAEALPLIGEVDAVITDLFFPTGNCEGPDMEAFVFDAVRNGAEQRTMRHWLGEYQDAKPTLPPCGAVALSDALQRHKPAVMVTSTYHHGQSTNFFCVWTRSRGLEMFDCHLKHGETEGAHKPWKEALFGLLYLVLAIESGECAFHDGVMKRPDGRHFGAVNHLHNSDFFTGKPLEKDWQSVMRNMVELGFPRT